jgi:hypothetical protein
VIFHKPALQGEKMKQTYHIKILTVLWTIMGTVCFVAAPAIAAEPAWWTQQKRDCGLPSGLAYNNWDGRCNAGGSTSTPSYDNGAAQRAREAEAAAERQVEAERIERERLAEEKRKKDAEFIRDRDAAANTLKGSTGPALNQLKGLSGADNSGLKGSAFDAGSTGSKGLRGSDHFDEKTSSQPATLLKGSSSGKGDNEVSKNKDSCRPSQDTSIVDLCFLGDKPAMIDPIILKGMNPAERTALKTSAKNMAEDLRPFDKEIYQALADMTGVDSTKTVKQWPGPNNPGIRYLNPLSEPEKVRAYWEKVNARLHVHAEVEAKIVTAPKGTDWSVLSGRMDADPKFRQSKEQIIHNQDTAEGLARHQMFVKFREFLEKQGGTDWPERLKNDKLFAARMVMERSALFKKMDQEIYNVRGKALQQMTVLVKGWKEK